MWIMTKRKSRDPWWLTHSIFNLGGLLNLDTHFQSKTAYGKHQCDVHFTDKDMEAQRGQRPAWCHTGRTEVELCCELRPRLPTLLLESLLWKSVEWSKDKAYALGHQVLSLQRIKHSERDSGQWQHIQESPEDKHVSFPQLDNISFGSGQTVVGTYLDKPTQTAFSFY